jgi:hypothetical protein
MEQVCADDCAVGMGYQNETFDVERIEDGRDGVAGFMEIEWTSRHSHADLEKFDG